MLPQVPQKVVISTVFFNEKPIAAQGEEEQYSFHRGSNPPEGESKRGAINEDLRGKSEDPQGKFEEPGRKSTRLSGNREQGDRAKRAFRSTVISVGSGKANFGSQVSSRTEMTRAAVRFRTGSSKLGRRGGHSQGWPPFAFVG